MNVGPSDLGQQMITIEFTCGHKTYWASLVAQLVKNLTAMQKTWVQYLGWEDLLEKEMATLSSILAWETHEQRSLADYSPWGCKEL